MSLRIALGQINPVVGDIDRNVARMVAVIDEGKIFLWSFVAHRQIAVRKVRDQLDCRHRR